MPDTSELLPVTQADRDAAAAIVRLNVAEGHGPNWNEYWDIRAGDRDGHPTVQAFARHRIEAQRTPSSPALPLIGAIAEWERDKGTLAGIMPHEYAAFCKRMARAAIHGSARAALSRSRSSPVAEARELIDAAIATFDRDPPDTDHQRGYLAALKWTLGALQGRGTRALRVAGDKGAGHRCNTHDRTNPYDPTLCAAEHAAWNAGWDKMDRELNDATR